MVDYRKLLVAQLVELMETDYCYWQCAEFDDPAEQSAFDEALAEAHRQFSVPPIDGELKDVLSDVLPSNTPFMSLLSK